MTTSFKKMVATFSVFMLATVLVRVFTHAAHPTQSGAVADHRMIDSARLLTDGDASARLPGCRTVETDWGTCLDAGTYVGDPVLLMGNRPYFHGVVTVDYRGADAPAVSCPAGTPPGTVCLERLPFGSPRIEVREGP